TGNVVVTTGVAHTVSEALATGTSLSNYDVVIGGNCAADGTVTLQAGDSKLCTITNTRKSHKVTLTKVLLPSGDSGRFDLTAAGTTVQNQGDGGSAQNTSVAVGTANVTVGEIANVANGANLTNYTSALTCTGATIPASTTSATFTMPDNDVSCIVT